jgi:hypothetical protein
MHALLLSLLGLWQNGSLSRLKWTKQVIVRRSHIRTEQRMLQQLEVQMVEAFNGASSSMQTGVTVQHCDIF